LKIPENPLEGGVIWELWTLLMMFVVGWKECCVWLAWTLFAMEIYCTGLLSQKSNVPLQQPKPSRLPTNLISAHSNICSSFCHNRAHKGLLQCSLFEELWGIIFFQHCWWVLVKMRITWDSQVWVPRSVLRVCALPLTGTWQKLRVEKKISSFEERGGYGRLSCCVAAILLFMLWVPETPTAS
jgi:hypothetical protein